MSNIGKYDNVLSEILINEKSIIGFLSTVFNFLSRRTDFYYVPERPDENIGFPPGVAEELVIKVLRTCDPKNWKPQNGANKPQDFTNEIMCSTVAQEVEITSDDIVDEDTDSVETTPIFTTNEETPNAISISTKEAEKSQSSVQTKISECEDIPPVIPMQKNSEAYNGAVRQNYSWSQTIMELDVTVRLPSSVKSSKDVKVTINATDICVACKDGTVIIKDTLPFKIKASESFWTISESRLLIHLEKVQERWWEKLLSSEEPIDLSKIDCSRPLAELPEDHIAKVRELQWNQEQKSKGLPTSEEIRNIQILKKAWNAEGSPFKGQEFDPNILKQN